MASHGFSTRVGGVSAGPLASLNLSFDVGDDAIAVVENLGRLRRYLGSNAPLLRVRQVHGDKVVLADELLGRGFDGWTAAPDLEADVVVGRASQGILAVATADCAPVLLVDPRCGVCAAVHVGWRGLKGKVVRAAVRALCALGSEPASLLAAVGPRICEECYEVGPEVSACFPESSDPLRGKPGKFSLNLGNATEVSLLAAGLRGDRIDVLPHCTSCNAALFYSYRRDRGNTGRSFGFVWL